MSRVLPNTENLMLGLLPRPPNRLTQISIRHLFPTAEIPRSDLSVDLYSRIRRDTVFYSTRGVKQSVKEVKRRGGTYPVYHIV